MPSPRAVLPRAYRRTVAVALPAVLIAAGLLATPASAAPTQTGVLPDTMLPSIAADTDRVSVELGMQFTATHSGRATGLQFYRSHLQEKAYTGTLWTDGGRAIATTTFPASSEPGWQTAKLSNPVPLRAGETYLVSYLATDGAYAVTEGGFAGGYRSEDFTVPAGGGLYRYGSGGFPNGNYLSSNYLVDIVFEPDVTRPITPPQPTPTEMPSPQPTPTSAPEPTPTETSTPTPKPTATPSRSPAPTAPVDPPSDDGTLDLPRIPWEGGPEYWSQFSDASEWTDPAFFPVGIWFNGVSTDAEVAWDKAHGINTYSGMWEGTDFSLFEDNDVYWLGGKLNSTFDEDSPNWPGVAMDDEVDGRYSPSEGIGHLNEIASRYSGSGKFMYTNYTQMVIGSDLGLADQEAYVNLPDAVSLDMYWYTIPFCDWAPYRGTLYAEPVPQSTCRTASSYGKAMNGLTIRDAADGVMQPRWMFLENLNGLSGQSHVAYITPGQVKGAAMSSVINEARGLFWFNQSFTGECQASSALRQAQTQGERFCGSSQIEAMGDVNNLIHSLAPVINTQSYEWTFGPGLDTMLKTYGGSAYIFAMTDGTTGARTFTLPNGIDATAVEVVNENRSLQVAGDVFSDDFANEFTFHIYRIPLG